MKYGTKQTVIRYNAPTTTGCDLSCVNKTIEVPAAVWDKQIYTIPETPDIKVTKVE